MYITVNQLLNNAWYILEVVLISKEKWKEVRERPFLKDIKEKAEWSGKNHTFSSCNCPNKPDKYVESFGIIEDTLIIITK